MIRVWGVAVAVAVLAAAGCGAQQSDGGSSGEKPVDDREVPDGFTTETAGGLRFAVPEEWTDHPGDTGTEAAAEDWDLVYEVERDGQLVADFAVHSQFDDGFDVILASDTFNNMLISEVGDVDDYLREEITMEGAYEDEAARADYSFMFTDDEGEPRQVRGTDIVVRTGEYSFTGVRVNGLEEEVPEETLEKVVESIEPE